MRIGSRGWLTALAVGLVLAVTACGGSDGGGNAARPRTPAQIEIVSPAPNAVTSPVTTVELTLRGARLVPATQIGGAIRPREGHIHVSIDGRVVAMVNSLTVPLEGLPRGQHVVDAEFVASDHLPFANRVVAATTFTVA